MRPVLFTRVVWLVILAVAVGGCGRGCNPGATTKPPGAAPLNELSTRELPPLGDYLPPLDKGRLEVAPPEGWHVPSASSAYVVRVRKSDQEKHPCVIVTAEDYDDQGVSDVSEENVEKFAAQVAEAVGKKGSAVLPRRIGGFVGVAYAKRGKVGPPTRILDLLYLETVVAGRKFRFELRSEEGSLEEDRPYLYAVVNGARFLEAASQPKQQESPQAEAEPQEKQPEDDQPDKQQPKPEPEETPEKKADEKADQEDALELDLDKLDELIK